MVTKDSNGWKNVRYIHMLYCIYIYMFEYLM